MIAPRGFALIALTLAVAGCGSKAPEEPDGEASSGSEKAAPANLRGHMSANFDLALSARDGVIAGSLIQSREAAIQLAEQDYSVLLPPAWMSGVERMQSAARELTGAEGLDDAAAKVAALAASCGSCHEEHGIELAGKPASADASFGEPEDVHARMMRHQRAADDFWFGLSVPSDQAWQVAAQSLLNAPMSPTDSEGKAIDPVRAAKIDAARAIARRALQATTVEARVEVYGELLATCANCHSGGGR